MPPDNATLFFETNVEDDRINLRTILSAFEEVQKYSVEAITGGGNVPSVFDFANSCIFFASINRWIPPQERDKVNVKEEFPEIGSIAASGVYQPPNLGPPVSYYRAVGGMGSLGDQNTSPQNQYNPGINFRDVSERSMGYAPSIVVDPVVSNVTHRRGRTDYPEEPSSETIGVIYLYPTQFGGEVSLGLSLAPPHRGKGFGKEAVNLLLEWAFDEVGYHRVQVMLLEGSGRDTALGMFTSLGFVHEGIRRRQVLSPVSGEYKDVTYMAMLDTEWLFRRYHYNPPNKLWEELFQRHQCEREELLSLNMGYTKLKRTRSTETVRLMGDDGSGSAENREEKQTAIQNEDIGLNLELEGADVLGDFLKETPPTGGWWSQNLLTGPSVSTSTIRLPQERRNVEGDDAISETAHSVEHSAEAWFEENTSSLPPSSETSSSSEWEIESEISDASSGWDMIENNPTAFRS